MKFPLLCRARRLELGLRQREVAQALGLKVGSYGNVESVSHRSMSDERLAKLVQFYRLDGEKAAEFAAAFAEMPPSPYALENAERTARRRQVRSKVKGFDRLRTRLLEVVGLLVAAVDDPGALCACPVPDPFGPDSPGEGKEEETCELCAALQELGLPGWTTRPDVVGRLAALQDRK